jgi:DNA-binding protein H-NS
MAKTLPQIEAQIAKLKAQAQALHDKEVAGVVRKIKNAIAHYQLTPEQLFAGSRRAAAAPSGKAGRARPKASTKGSKVPVKYRDADGNVWTGRGSQPRWIVAQLAQGRRLEDFLIKS